MSSAKPFPAQRLLLPFSGVRLECLDQHQKPIAEAVASGFLRRENGSLYLYTAWHVVTGFNPHHIEVGLDLPKRRYIRLALQDATSDQPGIQVIGGQQSVVVPLYANPSAVTGPLEPLWEQNDQHIPHALLNHVGIFVPFWNDVVRIPLSDAVRIAEIQVVSGDLLTSASDSLVSVGDKCLIVGFPYGFSAAIGVDQPTPVVFTRFIASAHIAGARKFEFFLDGYGAPGMSGGPVFLERNNQLYLIGVYTGDIFPDHHRQRYEKTTALGTVADIRMALSGSIEWSARPSSPLSRSGFAAD